MFASKIQDGVELKLLEERHAPVIFEVVERERGDLREWLPWVDTTTNVEIMRGFIKNLLQQFANNQGLGAGIWCGDEFAGTVGTNRIDWLNRQAELKYWIAAKFRRRGIITDGCRALINHAFREWKLNRLEIRCASGNERSRAIAKRLGFRLEGVLRECMFSHGEFVDAHVFGILARDWEDQHLVAVEQWDAHRVS